MDDEIAKINKQPACVSVTFYAKGQNVSFFLGIFGNTLGQGV